MGMISVRDKSDDPITEVTFGEEGELVAEYKYTDKCIVIRNKDEEDDEGAVIYKRDIPFLIKALQKAQELWPE